MPAVRARLRHPSARVVALLGRAHLPLTEGMLLLNGHRVMEVDAGGAVRLGDVRHDQSPLIVDIGGRWLWAQDDRIDDRAVPNPGDRGTWLLLLDLLCRRVGLDAAEGVFLNRIGSQGTQWHGWRVAVPGGSHDFLGGEIAAVTDDLEALAWALAETSGGPRHGH